MFNEYLFARKKTQYHNEIEIKFLWLLVLHIA